MSRTPSQSTRHATAATLVGDLRDRHDRAGKGEIRSTSIALRGADGKLTRAVRPYEPFDILVSYEAKVPLHEVDVSVNIETPDGTRLVTLYSAFRNESFNVETGHWNVRVPCRGSSTAARHLRA